MPLGRAGALGLAQGVADGVWGLAISPVAATLEAGTMVFSTVEAAALGADLHRPPPRLRPARSFFSSARLLPLAQCMMTRLEVQVRDFSRGPAPPRACLFFAPPFPPRHTLRPPASHLPLPRLSRAPR